MGMRLSLCRVSEAELEKCMKDEEFLEEKFFSDNEEDETFLDMDKSWDGILYLLTGKSCESEDYTHELAKVFFSGQEVSDVDLGYGSAQYVTAEQVKNLSKQIATITKADFRKRYDPSKMDDVYPSVWDEEGEEGFEYLYEYFKEVQKFYATAAEKGNVIMTGVL